ncbi:MAG: hypothetical protein GY856_31110 [bacterium]|nr:hypothetical protein [bacterium]
MADTTATTHQEELLRQARVEGRKDAEAFDLKLRNQELREREQRLAELAWKPRRPDQDWDDDEASLKAIQLEARVHELSSYLRAVENSLPWRAIQWVRRLAGRAW